MKKVVSLMLVLVMVLGMATVASAAGNVIGRNDNSIYEATFGAPANTDIVVQSANDVISTITFDGFTGSGILHDLNNDPNLFTGTYANHDFVDGAGNVVVPAGITDVEWNTSKITLKHIVTKGSAAIKEVKVDWASTLKAEDQVGSVADLTKFGYTIDGRTYTNKTIKYNPRLVIVYNDEFANNNPDGIDYEVKAYIVVNGRNWPDSGIIIGDKYKNDKQQYPIAADDSDVYIGDGTIAEAGDYNKSVEFHIGKNDNDDISLFSKVFKNRKYWALGSSADGSDEMYEKYSTLLGAYSVRSVGFVGSDVQIQFKDLDSGIYVYGEVDGELTYLGTGNQKLPYYTSYYYSDVMLDLASDEEPVEEDEDFGDDFEVPGETGGDDYYPENVNDNPGTGC